MCGICGFVSDRVIGVQQLNDMNDTMTHRGPDDAGAEILPFNRDLTIGLAHRRLSIQDLSESGHQPMLSNSGDTIVVFNGEIYNFIELRAELKKTYDFKSTCDTEVLIAAYEKWGESFIDHIQGMFAFALFDRKNEKLILARDRIGKKPLYYTHFGKHFVFASTLTPLMRYPRFEKKINKSALPKYLFTQYIQGENSVFEDVYKLRPGELLVYDGKTVKKRFYWSLIDRYLSCSAQPIKDYADAKALLKQELIHSTKQRMIADVPVGTFLSGGYDSSVVTAVAQSLSEYPVKTFSIGFEEKEYDEAPFAEAVAQHLGTDHENHYVTENEMIDLVNSIPTYYDEPFADSSQIPSMLVAQHAKRKVSVVLTGDGGDEFFCGYLMYEKLLTAQRIDAPAKIARAIIKDGGSLYNKMPFAVRAIVSNNDKRYKTQFGRGFYIDSIRKMLQMPDAILPYNESIIPVKNWQQRRMLLDSITCLPDNNLCKVDRATMRYSLEARNPLLDVGFIESSFRVPLKFKYYKGDKKHILKDLTYDYIPQELMDRPKKGFAVPIDKWLRSVLNDEVSELTNVTYLSKQGIFDPIFTSRFVQDYLTNGDKGSFTGKNASHIVWPLYMFQKWYETYMK